MDYEPCPVCGGVCVVLFDEATGEECCACLDEKCDHGYEVKRKEDGSYLEIPDKPVVPGFPLSRLEETEEMVVGE